MTSDMSTDYKVLINFKGKCVVYKCSNVNIVREDKTRQIFDMSPNKICENPANLDEHLFKSWLKCNVRCT